MASCSSSSKENQQLVWVSKLIFTAGKPHAMDDNTDESSTTSRIKEGSPQAFGQASHAVNVFLGISAGVKLLQGKTLLAAFPNQSGWDSFVLLPITAMCNVHLSGSGRRRLGNPQVNFFQVLVHR